MVEIKTYADGEDPRNVVLNAIGKAIDSVEVFGSRVLVATAPHKDRSKGGIIFTDKRLDEGRYQGKVGLILKVGPSAFKYDGEFKWEGAIPEVGDWVCFRPSDSWESAINGLSCRFILDSLIVGRVHSPEDIY